MGYTYNDYNSYFDVKYNNAMSNQAPGLHVFEKSLFLTDAYRQLTKEHAERFEYDEQIRKRLEPSVVDAEISYDAGLNTTLAALKIEDNSKVFEIPDNVWYVLQERVYTSDSNSIKVYPVRLDEYNEAKENPFEAPNNRKAWRLTIGDSISSTPKAIHEIVTTVTPTKYKFRYLKKPSPIIIEDLSSYSLSIEGETSAQIPNISDEFHNAIIDRAVKLATVYYKENNAQSIMAVSDNDS